LSLKSNIGFFVAGELKHKLAQKARLVMNTNKLVNSLQASMEASRAEKEALRKKEEEALSMKSYGSHIEPKDAFGNSIEFGDEFKDGSEYDDGLEKRDLSKEDLEWVGDDFEDSKEQPVVHVHPKPVEEEDYPNECCVPSFYEKFPWFAQEDTPFIIGWANIRLKTYRLIENKYFETAVIIMILLSSLALVCSLKSTNNSSLLAKKGRNLNCVFFFQALEDVHLQKNPVLTDILYYMDRIFTVIFFIEMLIKWLALGFQSYFTNAWCWLDFVIVMVSQQNIKHILLAK